jgi:diguanylate cyclase (GGDEF)-like protein/PAS domain S-box-containing protein
MAATLDLAGGEPAPLRPLRLLLVEDSEMDAELVVHELRRGGFEVSFRRVDTEAAYLEALVDVPDLIMADYNLPQFDALRALEVLGERGLDVPFIIVSGGIGEDVAVEAMRNGAADYLIKDRLARLGPAARRALEERRERAEKAHAQAALRESEQRFRQVFQEGAVGMAVLGPDLRFQDGNATLARMLGHDRTALARLRLGEIGHPEDGDPAGAALRAMFAGQAGSYNGEVRCVTAAGEVVWVQFSATMVRSDGGAPLYAICIFQDITERKRAEADLQHQALHDSLTGLPNRSLFSDRLQQAVLTARRDGHPMAILMIDMDRFKEINDSLGHSAGDALLRQTAVRLREATRDADTVARLGGDEFAVIPGGAADAETALISAQRLTAALEGPFVLGDSSFDIRASIGVAIYPEHGEDAETLMRHADVAMYVAKRAHNDFALYQSDQDDSAASRLTLMSELRSAITGGQLVLHYQPQVDLSTGRARTVEALVRWRHPTRGLLAPDEFIPAAEQTDVIGRLTRWVLSDALRQAHAWRVGGLDLGVAVNLSVADLHDSSLPDVIEEMLDRLELPPRCLTLEITERAIMVGPAQKTIQVLSQLGVGISIDDFGTGYSSLSYLRAIPVEEIKVDKSFVSRMTFDEDDATIVRATIDLGHNLRLRVLAEGAENQETWGMLAGFGCDMAQGYFVSRPMPAEQMAAWARTWEAPVQT